MANPALTSGTIESILDLIAKRQALGQVVPQTYIEQALEAALRETYAPSIQAAIQEQQAKTEAERLAEGRRQFERQLSFQEDLLGKQERAESIRGLANLVSTGAGLYLTNKYLKAVMDRLPGGGVPPTGTSTMTPTATTTGITALPAPTAEAVNIMNAGIPATLGAEEAQAAGAFLMSKPTEAAGLQAALSSLPTGVLPGVIGGLATLAATRKVEEAVGAGGGAAAGAVIGSTLVPGAGTVVGGIIGSLIGSTLGSVFRKGRTVICTELYEQGFIDADLCDRFHEVTDELPAVVKVGYYMWAYRVVNLMRRSRRFAEFVAWIAVPLIKRVAKRECPNVWKIGVAICESLGRYRVNRTIKVLNLGG